MIERFFEKAWMQLKPFPNALDKLARKERLASIRELDFELRKEVAISEWRKSEEGEYGMNWFEAGHGTYAGLVIAAYRFGPDVAAFAIENDFTPSLSFNYTNEEIERIADNLKAQAVIEGWNNSSLASFNIPEDYKKIQIYRI